MFGWFLVLISGSTLLSLFLTADTNYLPYESGGIVGMSISILTLDPLSFTGSSLLFFCVLLLGFTLSLNISWISIIYILQNFFGIEPIAYLGQPIPAKISVICINSTETIGGRSIGSLSMKGKLRIVSKTNTEWNVIE